jgi:hypothetical protein
MVFNRDFTYLYTLYFYILKYFTVPALLLLLLRRSVGYRLHMRDINTELYHYTMPAGVLSPPPETLN